MNALHEIEDVQNGQLVDPRADLIIYILLSLSVAIIHHIDEQVK